MDVMYDMDATFQIVASMSYMASMGAAESPESRVLSEPGPLGFSRGANQSLTCAAGASISGVYRAWSRYRRAVRDPPLAAKLLRQMFEPRRPLILRRSIQKSPLLCDFSYSVPSIPPKNGSTLNSGSLGVQ